MTDPLKVVESFSSRVWEDSGSTAFRCSYAAYEVSQSESPDAHYIGSTQHSFRILLLSYQCNVCCIENDSASRTSHICGLLWNIPSHTYPLPP